MLRKPIAHYPKGVMVGPDHFHEGPEFFSIEATGWYVWHQDYNPLLSLQNGWSLYGPYKTEEKAKARHAELEAGTKEFGPMKNPVQC